MQNRTKKFILPILVTITIFLSSWGYNGHIIVGWNMTFNLPTEMAEFKDWNTYLSQHSSDADSRKGSDPNEGPKHYIDIDSYTEFNETGSIPMNLDVLIEKYGSSFVKDQGYLPWVTIISYDSLVSKFKQRDWDKAKYYAADLSHYVADGFMPLHITANYNGQLTNNYGIHGRFESDMINKFKDEIQINVMEIDSIEGIEDYIFNYIYRNYNYVDSIMWADDYGKSVSSNTSSSAYLDAMWEYSKRFTLVNLNEATKAFSSLFYAAWEEAGKPLISITSMESIKTGNDSNLSFFPNPVVDYASISFRAKQNQSYELSLLNAKGSVMKKISDENPKEESIQISWDLSHFEPGMYFLSLQNAEGIVGKGLVVGE